MLYNRLRNQHTWHSSKCGTLCGRLWQLLIHSTATCISRTHDSHAWHWL